jgi:membrane protein required for colicin V production
MNPLDWLLAGILAFTAARGAFRGLIREMFGVGAVAGGYLMANLLHPRVSPGIEKLLDDPALGAVVAYGLTFFGCMLGLNLAGRMISRMMDANAVALVVNRMGGLCFGTLKGVLVAVIILFLARPLPAGQEMIEDSVLVPYLNPAADFLGGQFEDRLPENAKDFLHL